MNEQDPLDRGALSRKSNLWGLKLSERQRILQHVFRATTRVYHKDNTSNAANVNEKEKGSGGENASRRRACSKKDDDHPDDADVTSSAGDIEMGEIQSSIISSSSSSSSVGTSENNNDTTPGARESKDNMNDAESQRLSPEGAAATKSVPGDDTAKEKESVKVDCLAKKGGEIEEKEALGLAHGTKETTTVANGDDESLPNLDDMDHEKMCCICLAPYQDGESVMTGTQCAHLFHADPCCLEWLRQHDHCPYCRVEMVKPHEFRQAAIAILGEHRVEKLSMPQQQQLPPHMNGQHAASPAVVGVTVASNDGVDPRSPRERASEDEGDGENGARQGAVETESGETEECAGSNIVVVVEESGGENSSLNSQCDGERCDEICL